MKRGTEHFDCLHRVRPVNGQEMAEGRDGSGSEVGTECDSGRDETFTVEESSSSRRKNKKQHSNQSNSETDGEREVATPERERKKSKVIIKLVQDGAWFGEWNPVTVPVVMSRV